jgi:hypothetical protein
MKLGEFVGSLPLATMKRVRGWGAHTAAAQNLASLQFVCAAVESWKREMRQRINPGEQLAAQILLYDWLG